MKEGTQKSIGENWSNENSMLDELTLTQFDPQLAYVNETSRQWMRWGSGFDLFQMYFLLRFKHHKLCRKTIDSSRDMVRCSWIVFDFYWENWGPKLAILHS